MGRGEGMRTETGPEVIQSGAFGADTAVVSGCKDGQHVERRHAGEGPAARGEKAGR